MKQADFDYIEKELNITLPERYKEAALEAKTVGMKCADCFYDDPVKVVKTNLRLRKQGIYGQPLQPQHFVVGYDKCSGYYFIDLDSSEDFIYLADRTKSWRYSPENLRQNRFSFSLKEYIDHQIFVENLIRRHHENPPPERTDEEKQALIADFFARMNADMERMKQERQDNAAKP